MTGDLNPLHVEPEKAKETIFKGTIAHGLLTLGIALGQWYAMNLTRTTIVAFMGIEELSFTSPVRPGDTIYLKSVVISKRDSSSNSGSGLVTFHDQMFNQDNKIVLDYRRILMIKKRDPP